MQRAAVIVVSLILIVVLVSCSKSVQKPNAQSSPTASNAGEYDIDAINGAGFSYNTVKNDPEEFARIVSTPGVFTAMIEYDTALAWARAYTDGIPNNGELYTIYLQESVDKLGIKEKNNDGTVSAGSTLLFANTPAADQAKRDLEKFFNLT